MSTATILEHIYEGFGPEDEGEDYAFGLEQDQVDIATANAIHWDEVNYARREFGLGSLTWDGLVTEGYFRVRAETEPNLLTDRLLELAATLVAFAESVQRQTAAFNAVEEALPVVEETDEEEE